MEIELYKMEAEETMQKAVSQYISHISKVSTGRANPEILNSIKIIYYEILTPINEISSISVPEPRQLLIKPFDINVVKKITCAINNSNININAIDEGDKIRMTFPQLNAERRIELVKSLAQFTEQAKVLVRHGRQEANKSIKSDDLSEDVEREYHIEIQKLTNDYISKIDVITKEKEQDLMTI